MTKMENTALSVYFWKLYGIHLPNYFLSSEYQIYSEFLNKYDSVPYHKILTHYKTSIWLFDMNLFHFVFNIQKKKKK